MKLSYASFNSSSSIEGLNPVRIKVRNGCLYEVWVNLTVGSANGIKKRSAWAVGHGRYNVLKSTSGRGSQDVYTIDTLECCLYIGRGRLDV